MNINEIVSKPKVLLPSDNINYEKWAVVACDQFTSNKTYWEELEKFVGREPSTLNMIFPEVYLGVGNNLKRISKINDTMNSYLKKGNFKELEEGFILVVRKTPYNERRLGILLLIDLEKYSFSREKTPIRATEATILERIPPRVKIRENAPLEFPHIMLLIDDKEKLTIEPIFNLHDRFKVLYDFELSKGGGHITGYQIDDSQLVYDALQRLLDEKLLKEKYDDETPFLFAVGDGNHSLATARACWEYLKETLTDEEKENHPSRYALVEVVNLYDDGLTFEPIHRVVKNVDVNDFIQKFQEVADGDGASVEILKHCSSISVRLGKDVPTSVFLVDKFISLYKESNPEISVDYIHGEEELMNMVDNDNNCIGILLDKIEKETLFPTIVKNGSLARKSFSMGEAVEKRYYLEGRKIR